MEQSAARERLIQAAEELFGLHGYAAVRLRDIASRVGIHHATVYHHVPGGKEELFVEVMTRGMRRHQTGIENALAQAPADIHAQLLAAALWLVSQPPMDLNHMLHSDLKEISDEHATEVERAAYDALLVPLERLFVRAGQEWGSVMLHPTLAAAGFLFMILGIHNSPDKYMQHSKQEMTTELVNIYVNGIRPR